MRRHIPNGQAARLAQASLIPQPVVDGVLQLFNAGQWDELARTADTLTRRHPGNPLGWRALGKALTKQGRHPQAIQALQRLLKLCPQDAGAHNDLGLACQFSGQLAQAEAHFRKAVSLDAACVEALGNLAVLLGESGRLEEALPLHQQCLAHRPQSPVVHNNVGSTLQQCHRRQESLPHFQEAVRLAPQYTEAWMNLGAVLFDLQRCDEALVAYRQALALQPDSAPILTRLGSIMAQLKQDTAAARAMLERAVALDPRSADALLALGNALLGTGQAEQCEAVFRQAVALRPLVTWPASRRPANFSVLVLDTPLAGSTPIDYFMSGEGFDVHICCVLPGHQHDIDMLRSQADVVFNIISDADNGERLLPEVRTLMNQLGLPGLNHPDLVCATDRATIAAKNRHLPHCRVPLTLRKTGREMAAAIDGPEVQSMTLPVLVRLAGNHGGDELEKADGWAQAHAFAAAHPDEIVYLTEFVDFRSADGQYRKYRFISLDGEIFPYHLAIHDDWLVHHFRTDMAEQAWKRDEELAFLQHPEQVFGAQGLATIKAIADGTGLNYCGIDCALDQQGQVVIFEVNATMLVHDEKAEPFLYKNPHVARIKAAFGQMLARHVQGQPKGQATPQARPEALST